MDGSMLTGQARCEGWWRRSYLSCSCCYWNSNHTLSSFQSMELKIWRLKNVWKGGQRDWKPCGKLWEFGSWHQKPALHDLNRLADFEQTVRHKGSTAAHFQMLFLVTSHEIKPLLHLSCKHPFMKSFCTPSSHSPSQNLSPCYCFMLSYLAIDC